MNTQEKPVRVHSLRTQNTLAVEDIELTFGPEDSLIIVGGDNGAGKTSLIDSLFFAIGGKPDATRPIRDGAESAEIRLDLGDLVVTRRFKLKEEGGYSTTLKVENGEGAVYQSPQKLLDALISKFAFDPFEFCYLKEKDQEELVRTALSLDTTEIDAAYKEAFDKRTLVHAQQKELEVKTKNLPWHEDAPAEEVSITDLQEELRLANEHNAAITEARNKATAFRTQKLTAGKESIDRQEQLIADLKRQLADAETRLKSMTAQFAEWEKEGQQLDKEAAALGQPKDTDSIIGKLQGVQHVNEQVRANKQRLAAREEWQAKEQVRVELEQTLEELRTRKAKLTQEAVKQAKLAVEGLELTDEGLFLKGHPFRQCNTAEKLKLSVALAVKQNPRLRLFRIADGEKLTPKNMEALRKIAEEAGAQILVEFACTREDVENGYRDVSVFIEEGKLAEVQRPAKEAVLA